MTINQRPSKNDLIRLRDVLKLIPVSKTCWWSGVRSGLYPKPIKISSKVTAWRAKDIYDFIDLFKSDKTINNSINNSLMRLPEVLSLIPISKSTWYLGTQSGKFPKPTKLGPRMCVWHAEDIYALIDQMQQEE